MEDYIVTEQGDKAKNMECTTECQPIGTGNSWKQYWIGKIQEEWPKECIICDCKKDAAVGAHVHVNRYPLSDVFIIPTCRQHNHYSNEGSMRLDPSKWAARVSREDTRGEPHCYGEGQKIGCYRKTTQKS